MYTNSEFRSKYEPMQRLSGDRRRELLTLPVTEGALDGITRGFVIELASNVFRPSRGRGNEANRSIGRGLE